MNIVAKAWGRARQALLPGRQALWVTLYLTAQTLYWYQPWTGHSITEFDRVMGNATLGDVLISGRTSAALVTLLVYLPALLALYWWLTSLALGEKKNAPGAAHGPVLAPIISVVSGMGLALLALRYAKNFGRLDDNWLDSEMAVPLTLVACLLLWCVFRRALPARVTTLGAENVLAALLAALPVSFVLDMLTGVKLWAAAQYGVIGVIVLLLCMLLTLAKPLHERPGVQFTAGVPLLCSLPAALVYLELTQILTQYGVAGGDRRLPVLLILLACFAGCIGVMIGGAARRNSLAAAKPADWKKTWYPLLLVGLALLARQPELQNYVNSDFFERANPAVSISGFLNFGQIPSVETHAAHMGVDYLNGILWGLVNGDAVAACFMRYSGVTLALTTLLFYALLRRCIGRDGAFFAALLLPMIGIAPGDWYCHLSYLPALVLLWLQQKKSFDRYAAFWGAAAFSVLYRGDIGLAVGLGAVLVALADAVISRSARLWKSFVLSFAAVGGGIVAVLAGSCFVKGIDPISRLREFMEVMAGSNQNWAFESLGAAQTAGFAWTYLVTPVLLVGLTLAALLRLRKGAAMTDAYWLFFVFTAGYFLNFPRTLVRHSLFENIPVYCLSVGVWALALGLWLLWRDRAVGQNTGAFGRVLLPLGLLLVTVVSGAFFDSRVEAGACLVSNAYSGHKEGAVIDYQLVAANGTVSRAKTADADLPRAVYSADMRQVYQPLLPVMDALLAEGETWLDFTNQSALYAILGRRSPVYVNQSPAMLSGEYAQQCFIDQIEAQADKVPLALLPAADMTLGFSWDGVTSSLRYYRVAEYIYQNYTPYKLVGGFALWVRNDRWDEITAKPLVAGSAAQLATDLLRPLDAELTLEQDGSLLMTATGIDPQFDGLHHLLESSRPGQLTVSITYTSDTAGTLQLFHAGTGRNYTEESSVYSRIEATETPKTVIATLDWTPGDRLRLDTPEGSTVRLLEISTGESATQDCGYDYAPAHAHEHPMGAIARLWGENDEARAWENPEVPRALVPLYGGVYDVSTEAQGGENGRYVKLVITSPVETNATLSLVDRSAGSQRLAGFHFDLAEGTHTYLIRVSCDSYWYSGMANGLTLAVNGRCTLESIAVLDGD